MEKFQKNMTKSVKYLASLLVLNATFPHVNGTDVDYSPSNPVKFQRKGPTSSLDFPRFISDFEAFLRGVPKGQRFIKEVLNDQWPKQMLEWLAGNNVLVRYQQWYVEQQRAEVCNVLGETIRNHEEEMHAVQGKQRELTYRLAKLKEEHLEREQAQEEKVRALTQVKEDLDKRHAAEKLAAQAELEVVGRNHAVAMQAAEAEVEALTCAMGELRRQQTAKEQAYSGTLLAEREAGSQAIESLNRKHAEEIKAEQEKQEALTRTVDDLRRQQVEKEQAQGEKLCALTQAQEELGRKHAEEIKAEQEKQEALTRTVDDLRRQQVEKEQAQGEKLCALTQAQEELGRKHAAEKLASQAELEAADRNHAVAMQAAKAELKALTLTIEELRRHDEAMQTGQAVERKAITVVLEDASKRHTDAILQAKALTAFMLSELEQRHGLGSAESQAFLGIIHEVLADRSKTHRDEQQTLQAISALELLELTARSQLEASTLQTLADFALLFTRAKDALPKQEIAVPNIEATTIMQLGLPIQQHDQFLKRLRECQEYEGALRGGYFKEEVLSFLNMSTLYFLGKQMAERLKGCDEEEENLRRICCSEEEAAFLNMIERHLLKEKIIELVLSKDKSFMQEWKRTSQIK